MGTKEGRSLAGCTRLIIRCTQQFADTFEVGLGCLWKHLTAQVKFDLAHHLVSHQERTCTRIGELHEAVYPAVEGDISRFDFLPTCAEKH